MAVARPWAEDQEKPGIGARHDRVALAGVELEEVPGTCRRALGGRRGHLHLTLDHQHPRPLVHLVLLQLLPGREAQQDRPRVLSRGEDLRLVGLRLDALQVPTLHRAPCFTRIGAPSEGQAVGRRLVSPTERMASWRRAEVRYSRTP